MTLEDDDIYRIANGDVHSFCHFPCMANTITYRLSIFYPRRFDNEKREIYVRGEVFLDVSYDENLPFLVTTDDFDLRVLGTKFTITNYKSWVFICTNPCYQ